MWIIGKTPEGTGVFLSAVQHQDSDKMLRVRARRQEHLAAAFPHATIEDLGEDAPDYRWHANVARMDFALLIADMIGKISYTSHVKESVSGDDNALYSSMMGAWDSFYRMQKPDAFWNRQGTLWGTTDLDGMRMEDMTDDEIDAFLDALDGSDEATS